MNPMGALVLNLHLKLRLEKIVSQKSYLPSIFHVRNSQKQCCGVDRISVTPAPAEKVGSNSSSDSSR